MSRASERGRTALAGAYFFLTSVSLYLTMAVAYPFKHVFPTVYRAWIDLSKRHWVAMLIHTTQLFAPSRMEVFTSDPRLRTRMTANDGKLFTRLAPRAVVLANHQLYNDWVYVWWLAYTSNLHGSVIIALKNSLKYIPIFGWAMRMFRFMFLKRRWVEDEKTIANQMHWLRGDEDWPAWLLLFPEGTVFNSNTSKRSREFYSRPSTPKRGPHPDNVLLPHSKGLQAALRNLDGSFPVLYDLTFYYPGVPADSSGEETYSLHNVYAKGQSPPFVRMYLRQFAVSEIPYKGSEEDFTLWLYERWQEKDEIFRQLAADDTEALDEPLKVKLEITNLGHLWGVLNVPLSMYLIFHLIRVFTGF